MTCTISETARKTTFLKATTTRPPQPHRVAIMRVVTWCTPKNKLNVAPGALITAVPLTTSTPKRVHLEGVATAFTVPSAFFFPFSTAYCLMHLISATPSEHTLTPQAAHSCPVARTRPALFLPIPISCRCKRQLSDAVTIVLVLVNSPDRERCSNIQGTITLSSTTRIQSPFSFCFIDVSSSDAS